MHHAPALSLDLRPDRGWSRGVQGLGTLVAATILVWVGGHAMQFGMPTAPVMAFSALSVGLAVGLWRKHRTDPHARHLAWHPLAGHWSLQTEGLPPRTGPLDCLADTGHWMLLRHRSPGQPPVWLPLSRTDHATHWHALRCAVFAPGAAAPTPLLTPAHE